MKSKVFLIKLINFYKKNLASRGVFRNSVCVFIPSCSEYALEAVNKYGALKGSRLAIFRFLRCHPWQKNRFDPVK